MTEKAQKIIAALRTGCDDASRCKDCDGFKWCHDPNFTLEEVAANLIEELSSEIEVVLSKLEKATRERDAAIDDLKDAQPNWISVKDALPEPGRLVIVCCHLIGGHGWGSGVFRYYICKYGRLVVGFDQNAKRFEDRAIFSEPMFYLPGRDMKPLDVTRTQVTHWMYLPEIPKGEQHEK